MLQYRARRAHLSLYVINFVCIMCLLQHHAISFMPVYLQYFKLDLRTEKLYYLLFDFFFFFGQVLH